MASTGGFNKAWVMRFGIMTLMALAFSGYFGYDGFVKYPHHNKISAAYQELERQGKTQDWPAYAAEQDWPTEVPTVTYSDMSVMTQKGISIGCGILGLIALGWILLSATRKVSADENGLKAGRKTVPYSDVTEIDMSRWDKKGIAVVVHKGGSIIIDDYKYKGGEDVLKLVEEHTGKGRDTTPAPAEDADENTEKETTETTDA